MPSALSTYATNLQNWLDFESEPRQVMKTVFLDIDGTLLRTQGAGLRAILDVMSDRYGVHQLPDVTVHGRTDRGIWQDVFRGLDLELPQDSVGELISDYCKRLQKRLDSEPGELLPGVHSLLESLGKISGVAVGILTGNAKRAAEIKLEHVGLASFMQPFGGFGDAWACRNEVAQMADESAKKYLGANYDPCDVWVVGDTVNDIRCARHIGAKVLAVATGGTAYHELESAEPDSLCTDFSDLDSTLAAIAV